LRLDNGLHVGAFKILRSWRFCLKNEQIAFSLSDNQVVSYSLWNRWQHEAIVSTCSYQQHSSSVGANVWKIVV